MNGRANDTHLTQPAIGRAASARARAAGAQARRAC